MELRILLVVKLGNEPLDLTLILFFRMYHGDLRIPVSMSIMVKVKLERPISLVYHSRLE
jgi:hypothetical protein